MPSDRRPHAAVALVALLIAGPTFAWAEAAPESTLVERIVAVVDGRPVLLSEARLLQALRGVDRETAVNALVDEALMLREALRLPQAAATPEEEERALESLRARAPALTGVTEEELRRLARRQTVILKYVEVRFRPQVRLSEEDVRKTFDAEYSSVSDPPPYESASQAIRERLTEAQLNERVEAWVKELRSSASMRINPEEVDPR
jgi:hypothetical protein